jgi:hypothetical protein
MRQAPGPSRAIARSGNPGLIPTIIRTRSVNAMGCAFDLGRSVRIVKEPGKRQFFDRS